MDIYNTKVFLANAIHRIASELSYLHSHRKELRKAIVQELSKQGLYCGQYKGLSIFIMDKVLKELSARKPTELDYMDALEEPEYRLFDPEPSYKQERKEWRGKFGRHGISSWEIADTIQQLPGYAYLLPEATTIYQRRQHINDRACVAVINEDTKKRDREAELEDIQIAYESRQNKRGMHGDTLLLKRKLQRRYILGYDIWKEQSDSKRK